MATRQPTEQDIESAKAYLIQRLSAEHSMSYNLSIVMREAAERIVGICYDAKIDPAVGSYEKLPAKVQMEIEEVVQWLKETIGDYFLTLAIYDHEENRDKILPFILGESYGFTFNERLEDYCEKYRDELLLLIGAGLYLGLSKSALAKTIGEHLKQPYKNPDLVDGIAAPFTYGRGRSNSMFTNINTLTKFGIGQAWMRNRHIDSEKKGAVFFMTFRNSTVQCDICDGYTGIMHHMDERLPPLHSSCVCGTLYFDANGLPI